MGDATGFPETHNGFLQLTWCEIESRHAKAPVTLLLATRIQLAASGQPGHSDIIRGTTVFGEPSPSPSEPDLFGTI